MISPIQYNEEDSSYKSRTILGQPKTPKMIGFLIRKGIVKNEKSAGVLLIFLISICVILTIYTAFLSKPFLPILTKVESDQIIKNMTSHPNPDEN